MKKVTLLAASLAMVFTAASPAMAQSFDFSDDDGIDDDSVNTVIVTDNSQDNDQVFTPTVTQSTVITQGGSTAVGGGDAFAFSGNSAFVYNGVFLTAING